MPEFGVTDQGFVLKRMDTILEEIHADLTAGFGFDTRMNQQSFLNVLVTTFGGQIADLWEVLQDHYYAKYPATADGVNLDNSIQYGGIRRAKARRTVYPLHCTGDDGTSVRAGTIVASNTMPKINLTNMEEFQITRSNFNRVKIRVAAVASGIYTVSINGTQYSYSYSDGGSLNILNGLAAKIVDARYTVSVNEDSLVLLISDNTVSRSNILILSENLTTASVTTIADFSTEQYGKIVLPDGTITEIVTSIRGLNTVENHMAATYGRLEETDVELRQSYLSKSAIRSTRMIDSITSHLLNNVAGVESATGYENETNETDRERRPPHSIEIVVDGGNETDIAQIILDKKAGGIQTYGAVEVSVQGTYGELIPIRFNRPEYVYTWLRVILTGNSSMVPANYANLTIQSIMEFSKGMVAGDSLLIQQLMEGIYDSVSGITYIQIETVYSTDSTFVPDPKSYWQQANVVVSSRQKVVMNETMVEVNFYAEK